MRKLLRCILVFAVFCSVTGQSQQSRNPGNGSITIQSESSARTSSTGAVLIQSGTTAAGNGTCASRTANYITHTLPQQCLRTDRQSSGLPHNSTTNDSSASRNDSDTTPSSLTEVVANGIATKDAPESPQLAPGVSATAIAKESTTISADESETDSPLDNAKFLSFEEWKKQAVAKYPEQGGNLRERGQRPGINNALEGYGEDGEIELDFSGFGATPDSPKQQRTNGEEAKDPSPAQSAPYSPSARSKDAGKTCKERTNYASFDCAATMLKNNKECKSASSVLVENKDSYMLNTCSAQNKFFIVELCDLILVDTVVLANYEFFSSIFRHFRVSVSDTYPVKMEKWTELGTFEARNTREVQAFLIEHSKIWARYLRIEFLTHYGSEYYCPISLLRVHGTTMLEEIRAQEEHAAGDREAEATVDVETSVAPLIPQEPAKSTDESFKGTMQAITTSATDVRDSSGPLDSALTTNLSSTASAPDSKLDQKSNTSQDQNKLVSGTSLSTESFDSATRGEPAKPTAERSDSSQGVTESLSTESNNSTILVPMRKSNTSTTQSVPKSASVVSAEANGSTGGNGSSVNAYIPEATTHDQRASTADAIGPALECMRSSTSSESLPGSSTDPSGPARVATSSTAPAQPQPSTQESFFKSIHKRLQQLESNSTLSLQYIEEQSRILRDAFSKVEKRQISATTSFLTNLNETVMNELRGFREAYDQLWQSTVIELEGSREQYQREMLALSTRLTLVADELVWQKRMGIVQSTLLLLCLGLVLFARGGNTGYLEVPIMQQVMNRSTAALSRGGWESPPVSPSPESRSPVGLFRRKLWRSVTDPSVGNVVDDTMSGTDSRPQTREGTETLGLSLDVNVEPPTPPRGSESADGAWNDSEEGEAETLDSG